LPSPETKWKKSDVRACGGDGDAINGL